MINSLLEDECTAYKRFVNGDEANLQYAVHDFNILTR